jgi:Tol biopolymer transport system component
LRLTHDPTDESRPLWLPEEKGLVFNRVPDLYTIDVAGGAEAKLLYADEWRKSPTDLSPDGRWLMFTERQDSLNLRVLDLRSGEARDWLATEWEEEQARFSPDGRWVAYMSNESGRTEIWIDSFPVRGERFRVSTGGGKWPVWRPDGKELFYYSDAQQVMAVPVDMGSERHPIGEPRPLFRAKLREGMLDVSPDGRRLLVLRQLDVSASSIVLEQK